MKYRKIAILNSTYLAIVIASEQSYLSNLIFNHDLNPKGIYNALCYVQSNACTPYFLDADVSTDKSLFAFMLHDRCVFFSVLLTTEPSE